MLAGKLTGSAKFQKILKIPVYSKGNNLFVIYGADFWIIQISVLDMSKIHYIIIYYPPKSIFKLIR